MGACLCKQRTQRRAVTSQSNHDSLSSRPSPASIHDSRHDNPILVDAATRSSENFAKLSKFVSHVDSLVMETLALIKHLVDNDQQPPHAMLVLHKIADKEPGWLAVVSSLVHMIPLNNPLGPAVVTMLIDECPIPSKEAMLKLISLLKVSGKRLSHITDARPEVDRNICIVLGCLAEKLAGPSSVALLTYDVLQYLFVNLREECHPVVILQSIVALEKFAQTRENKVTICHALASFNPNPFLALETLANQDDFTLQEVTFSAQWCLDNLFLLEGRPLSYETVDLQNVSVMLNGNDVSEYLKISPDGLKARCDAASFESVRCTFHVDAGCWYYEVKVVSAGVMQIGWATRDSKFLNHEGYGIGDDPCSVAYDGCRQLLWHEALSISVDHPPWSPGDILGMLLDIDHKVCSFILNGKHRIRHSAIFNNTQKGFFAAASFMSFQQCSFNFGSQPFKYPPSSPFKAFNDYGTLDADQKVILPRHKKLALIQTSGISEHCCMICCDLTASIILLPCRHTGFCSPCTQQISTCPVCRRSIEERQEHIAVSTQDLAAQRKISDGSASSMKRRSCTAGLHRRESTGQRSSDHLLNNVNAAVDEFVNADTEMCDFETSFGDENADFITDRSFKIFDKDRAIYCEICYMEINDCKCSPQFSGHDATQVSKRDARRNEDADENTNANCRKNISVVSTPADQSSGQEIGADLGNGVDNSIADTTNVTIQFGDNNVTCNLCVVQISNQDNHKSSADSSSCATCACHRNHTCTCARKCGGHQCACTHNCCTCACVCSRGCSSAHSHPHRRSFAHNCSCTETCTRKCSCSTVSDVRENESKSAGISTTNMNRNITTSSDQSKLSWESGYPSVIDELTVHAD